MVLLPLHCADVCEILVRQVDHPLEHVVLVPFDEKRAAAIAHTTQSLVQQEPGVFVFLVANFDQVPKLNDV
jgi:hypothetical protein